MVSTSDALLGLDLGTSSVKTVMFARDGRVLAAAQRDYPTARPHPRWAEQDAENWWEASAATMREVVSASAVQPRALGITSQSSAVVAVDQDGRVLRPAPLWLDRRATAECDLLRETMAEEEIIRLSGNRIDPSYLLPKLLWLRQHEPEVYTRARWFLHANGFLVWRLTGAVTTDLTEGGMSLLYDIASSDWCREILDRFDLPAAKLPPMTPSAQVVGQVTPAAAAATGLQEGIPVIAGCMDLLAAATGAGVMEEGQSFLVLGTATVLASVLDAPQPYADLQMHNHALPRRWVHAANVDYGGAALSWLREVFRQVGAELDYPHMARMAAATMDSPPGLLFVPYMVGQRAPLWDDDCRGVLFGLQPEHTAGHLIRAVIEGNALALGRLQALQEEVHQRPIEEIHISGGQSALPLVNQIVADVTGRPVLVMDTPAVTCHGAALLAGLGVGAYASPADMTTALRIKARYEPRPEQHERYLPLRSLLAEVYAALRPTCHRLAGKAGEV